MNNTGVNNSNFRGGDYRKYVAQIVADATNPATVHPREVKLAQLANLMGAEKYTAWYERNRGLNVAKWNALVDAELAQQEKESRIAALFAEYKDCDVFIRALEIEQELHGYGVVAVTEEENRKLENFAEMRTAYRSL